MRDGEGVPQVTTGSGSALVRSLKTTAKAFGVFNSPTDGTIRYVDPNHDSEAHHSPLMTRGEADYAYERGLIEDPADAKEVTLKTVEVERDQHAIGRVGAARTEEFARNDDEGGLGSGSLDSRSSTAWADRDRVEGGAQGFTSGQRPMNSPQQEAIDHESGDEDAPPARRKPAAKAG